MSSSIVKREAGVGSTRRWYALTGALGLAAIALGGAIGQFSATPAGASVPALAMIGPGKLGQLRAAMLMQGQGAAVPAGLPGLARLALDGAPLSDEPFAAAAADGFRTAKATGSSADAKLLAEAIRRNQRARGARLMLLHHALAAKDLNLAVDQFALLTRLGNTESHKLIEALGMAVSSPRQVDEAIAAFNAHPELYRDFLLGFSARPKPPQTAARLAARLPSSVVADDYLRQIVLKFLVDAGAYRDAKTLWQRHSGAAAKGWIHSPDFADVKASPPFNWELAENEVGASARLEGGGLSAAFYGRQDGKLASQLLTLPAGPWHAKIDYKTEADDPGLIVLRVRCAISNVLLGELPLDASVGKAAKSAMPFIVPAVGCPGQYLALEGVTGEGHPRQEVHVRRLDVSQGGGA